MTEWTGILVMKINNLGYLLKEGIRSIFLHGFMSFAAVCVTVACLLIVGSFSAITYNLNLIVEDLNKTNEILVFVDETLSDTEAKSVGTKINRVENIEEAIFISREEALENFAKDHQDSGAFEGLPADTLRHRFRVVLEDNNLLEQTKEDLRKVPGVAGIQAAEEEAKLMTSVKDAVSWISLVLIVALLIVSLLIISNTVKIAMSDRRDEIAIMKMVGATNGFIRLPFVVQGFLLGIVGAGIAFGLEWLIYNGLATQLQELGPAFLTLVPFTDLLLPMIIIFASAGIFVGIMGSFASIRKYMDV